MRETTQMVLKVPSSAAVALGGGCSARSSRAVSPTQFTPNATVGGVEGGRSRGMSTSSFPAMPVVDLNFDEQVAARSFAFGASHVNVSSVVPAAEETHTTFVEVVLGPRSAAIGTSVASGHFQLHYNVTILGVRSVSGFDTVTDLYLSELAHHVLSVGDTVLLLARENFREEQLHMSAGEFIVMNEIESSAERHVEGHYMRLPPWAPQFLGGHELKLRGTSLPIRVVKVPEWYPYSSIVIFLIMLGFAIANYDLAVLALIATIVVVGLGLTTTTRAIAAVEWEVIIMVAFSFTLAAAMTNSGFSQVIAQSLRTANVQGISLLYLIAVLSTVMTNVITNKACVQVLVPIVVATYREQGKDPLPAVMMTCALASMALSTPYGFATNLMVMGPGGYKPIDFIKFGLPLNILATVLLPMITALVYKMDW
ncbi:sodium/sulphate symporter, putative [Bodo saltans]|uniref:Sodium/sulphate symporter, putative n=1 Tax=Bodo saltans TaxID=75058 RepID=A0A0S4KFE0_BODSA|nr:sodium/sulphate symporter, putative [Bodo saltans]|eukprot:CUI11267.1 sodium/sulphate symporter, putative [Bodo saltans]